MTLDLDENEITGIINVFGQLPTESNAWPLREKIKYQFEIQKEAAEVPEGPTGSDVSELPKGLNGPAA